MEVDEVQTQVSKFQKITSNPNKIATNYEDSGGNGGGVGRLCGWPSSRIVRVSRGSGGKDRHSKVLTSKGLRDRRVRLSVTTAIQFYDLQDRLGYDQPSKAVEWLIKAASGSISELPSLDPSFSNIVNNHHINENKNNNVSISKSSSSTSENSKGSGLSLSRSENRVRARERARAREQTAKKEKGININHDSQSGSFTDLLTAGVSNPGASGMDYFQMQQFNHHQQQQHQHQQQNQHQHNFSFIEDNLNFEPVVTTSGSGGGLAPGFNRGTLQSNLLSVLPHHNHLQRFQQSTSMVDGSTSTNFPVFMAPNMGMGAPDHFPATGYDSQRYGGGSHSHHHKEKSKN